MALSVTQTAVLGPILKSGRRVASMGYPDIIAPMEMVEKVMGDEFPKLTYRPDSEAICKRHGIAKRDIPDAHSFFKAMGCALDVYDIVKERGCEILCDLNHPIVSRGSYDIVLDVGTAEHCFNIGQAIVNMADMVRKDGYIIHENPFNCGNHGFYNLNPTWYHDFYTTNGFDLLACALVDRHGASARVSYTKRFKFTEVEVNTFAMAQRKTIKTLAFPMQTKYAVQAAAEPGEGAANLRAIGA